jgi:hypothetical protein
MDREGQLKRQRVLQRSLPVEDVDAVARGRDLQQ